MLSKEDLKKSVIKNYKYGDINCFEALNNLIDNCEDEEITTKLEELLPILYKLNYLNSLFENGFDAQELNNIFSNHRIEDMYIELKQLLFDILDIKETDNLLLEIK